MTDGECHRSPQKAARLAAKILRQHGYVSRYSHRSWDRGVRWYRSEADNSPGIAEQATSVLGRAIASGEIKIK